MKKMKFFILIAIAVVGFAFTAQQKKAEVWKVPAEYKTMENPLANDKASVNTGKMVYMKHCRSCHGNAGLGDGPKAARLKTFPGDFSSAEFQGQSDGEIMYKAIFGRDDMPNYETKIPSKKERWAVVNYMRTFKK
ncbi:c-type cytochrome [Labilibaculum euxinus]|uniref:c-type cytochrome n=1 Tax=Labilibaculum euxinus TaxID=2686357 RepID=UPI001CDD15DD|nr:cytochrome c [Labilibaculum euxinus]MDQ1770407.1 cytochrome c [Labilibaculum euxinus]